MLHDGKTHAHMHTHTAWNDKVYQRQGSTKKLPITKTGVIWAR